MRTYPFLNLLNTATFCLAAGLLIPTSVPAAVLTYDLTATGSGGTTGSGSFSFDDTVVGPNYSSFSASGDLLSFSVTLNVAGGTPSTTTFDLTTVGFGSFVLSRTSGTITDFNPGGLNGDSYELSPFTENMATLSGNGVNETITWGYTAVPEPWAYATVAGLGLLGFATARRARRQAPRLG